MKKIITTSVMLIMVTMTAAWAGEIIQMPEHGSLWKLAEECGQPGSAWPAIIAKNPWIKTKVVKGQRIAIVQVGQPILFPDDWTMVVGEEVDKKGKDVLSALWSDYCDIAKEYPIPSLIVFLFIIAIIAAKGRSLDQSDRQEEIIETEPEVAWPRKSCGRY